MQIYFFKNYDHSKPYGKKILTRDRFTARNLCMCFPLLARKNDCSLTKRKPPALK